MGHRDTRDHGRIIPARAGSTAISRLRVPTGVDHPRSCGEHSEGQTRSPCRLGSSPLVRGAPGMSVRWCQCAGIIPARAGSTKDGGPFHRSRKDHPRSCGEHFPFFSALRVAMGSSPLVRGAREQRRGPLAGLGIIPARAGSTVCDKLCVLVIEDHPRSCGEHSATSILSSSCGGSSPLVRGARFGIGRFSFAVGIIPARAGSTSWGISWIRIRQDHPRSCGEHYCLIAHA